MHSNNWIVPVTFLDIFLVTQIEIPTCGWMFLNTPHGWCCALCAKYSCISPQQLKNFPDQLWIHVHASIVLNPPYEYPTGSFELIVWLSVGLDTPLAFYIVIVGCYVLCPWIFLNPPQGYRCASCAKYTWLSSQHAKLFSDQLWILCVTLSNLFTVSQNEYPNGSLYGNRLCFTHEVHLDISTTYYV
jgi:hypothetical protein